MKSWHINRAIYLLKVGICLYVWGITVNAIQNYYNSVNLDSKVKAAVIILTKSWHFSCNWEPFLYTVCHCFSPKYLISECQIIESVISLDFFFIYRVYCHMSNWKIDKQDNYFHFTLVKYLDRYWHYFDCRLGIRYPRERSFNQIIPNCDCSRKQHLR